MVISREIDGDLEQPALVLVLVWRLHDDVAAHDLRAELLEPLRKLLNAGLERWR